MDNFQASIFLFAFYRLLCYCHFYLLAVGKIFQILGPRNEILSDPRHTILIGGMLSELVVIS